MCVNLFTHLHEKYPVLSLNACHSFALQRMCWEKTRENALFAWRIWSREIPLLACLAFAYTTKGETASGEGLSPLRVNYLSPVSLPALYLFFFCVWFDDGAYPQTGRCEGVCCLLLFGRVPSEILIFLMI